jgi:hypothetical protein
LLPLALIKSAPRVSTPQLAASTSNQLEQNRERQRQLERRGEGRDEGLDARDRRELEALVREERTLVRRERLAAENSGEGHNFLVRTWIKLEAVFRPLKLLGGLLLLLVFFRSFLVLSLRFAKVFPLYTSGTTAAEWRFQRKINMLLGVQSHDETGYVYHLLMHSITIDKNGFGELTSFSKTSLLQKNQKNCSDGANRFRIHLFETRSPTDLF